MPSPLEKALYDRALRHLSGDLGWRVVWQMPPEQRLDNSIFRTPGLMSWNRREVWIDPSMEDEAIYAIFCHEAGHTLDYRLTGAPQSSEIETGDLVWRHEATAKEARRNKRRDYANVEPVARVETMPLEQLKQRWSSLHDKTSERTADRLSEILRWHAHHKASNHTIAARLVALAKFPVEDGTE